MKAAAFLVVAFCICFALFGDALLGRSMLAPVDIAAAQWPRFSFVDPASGDIPQNHHIVDQLGYDLPLQWTIYHAWRRGEVPWWDPFTYGGRPLLADAHVSAADPLRVVCYLTLPRFELAYHWTRALHFLFGGLGLFYLTRRLGAGALVAGSAGLLGMCAGSVVLFFGHPWIHASFVYYPWLWLAWHRLWEKPSPLAALAAPALMAGAIHAGNLQAHAYLLLFALAFCLGYAGRSWRQWSRGLAIVVPTGLLAAMIASPILWPEIELFLSNCRPLGDGGSSGRVFEGLMTASVLWPWSVGTFHTVMGSILGFHPGFCAFIGTAGVVLAVLGARVTPGDAPRRCAAVLAGCFVVIMLLPPVSQLLYPRAAGLATLGGIVLAAHAAERLRSSNEVWRRAAKVTAVFALLVVLGTAAAVWLAYPRLKPRLLARMEAHALDDGTDGRSLPLRRAQVENYPREVGFTNPEVLAAWLALVALVPVFAVPRWRRVGVPVVLALNLIAPVLFARRFIPRVPIEQWERLLAGGPKQQEAKALLGPGRLRLEDEAGSGFRGLFPQELAHLYGIHVVHGYAALVPPNLAWSGTAGVPVDYRFGDDKFMPTERCGSARFSTLTEPVRAVAIADESLNTVTLDIGDGPAGWLLRTDTRYPGWQASTAAGAPLAMEAEGATFTKIELPAGPVRVRLRYEPTGHTIALALAALGLAGAGTWSFAQRRQARPACA